MILQWLDD